METTSLIKSTAFATVVMTTIISTVVAYNAQTSLKELRDEVSSKASKIKDWEDDYYKMYNKTYELESTVNSLRQEVKTFRSRLFNLEYDANRDNPTRTKDNS